MPIPTPNIKIAAIIAMFVMLKKEGVEAGYVSLSLSLGMVVDLGLRFIVAYVNLREFLGVAATALFLQYAYRRSHSAENT
jgi:hypothetical protein